MLPLFLPLILAVLTNEVTSLPESVPSKTIGRVKGLSGPVPTPQNFGSPLSETLPVKQNALVNPLGQQPSVNQNGFVNIPQSSQPVNQNPVNQNGLVYAQQQSLPQNQNGFVNPQQQSLSFNQNNFLNSRQQSLPVNQNVFRNPQQQPAPGGQNGLINNPQTSSLNLQNDVVSVQSQPLPANPNIDSNVPQSQIINQNNNLNPSTTPGSFIDSQDQNLPINRINNLNPPPPPGGFDLQGQNLPNNQNSFINNIETAPINQNPITQNRIINSQSQFFINSNSRPNQHPPLADLPEYPNLDAFTQHITQAAKVDDPSSGLEVAFQWKFLDWVHPTVQLTEKNFTVGNSLSQDVAIDRRGRVFVTSPQWLAGVPITLSVITDLKGSGGPLLTPYPDYTWHKPDCDSLVSVYRVAIDECNRLWMADTGFAAGQSVCPSKLMVFDLKTDELLLRYVIPADQTKNGMASYVNPVVDVGDSCDDTFVYVADVLGHGLLVFSLKDKTSWRIDNTRGNAFGSDAEATNLTIAGEWFELTDGTLGMSLSPKGFFDKRYLYFNSLASFYQKFADTDSLKEGYAYEPLVYQSVVKRASQAGAQATSRTGAIFFQLAQFTALACWNIGRPFAPENIVVLAQDEEKLQYVSSIKVIENAYGDEELWFNTNRLQKTINKSRKIDEVNFRFIRGKVDDLIRGTRCEPTGYPQEAPSLEGWRKV